MTTNRCVNSDSDTPRHRPRRFWPAARVTFFLAAVVFSAQLIPWRPAATIVPGLSPLLSLGGPVAARALTPWALLGLPLLLLAFFRSRWFCGHLCPTGYAVAQAGKLNPAERGAYRRFPHFGRWLLLVALGGAAAGYPFFLWLDPLSLFSGFFSAWHRPLALLNVLPAAGFALVLALSVLAPNLWCQRLCPLGALQETLGALGLRLRERRYRSDSRDRMLGALERRSFLGLLGGGLAALAARRVLGRTDALPVRPPGSATEALMTALCARCGNCIRACPYDIIRPDTGRSGVAGLLTPVIDQSQNYCVEWCNECNKVCPTGAIARLSLDAKRHTAIGLAEVTKTHCIAWANGDYCMVCQEFCPYLAIRSVANGGVNCPEVDPEMCRGCGTCHNQCPALPLKAINIRGIRQKKAKPLPSFPQGGTQA